MDPFGCKFMDGRAATAPQVRQGQSTKFTMVDGVAESGDICEVPEVETHPRVPHLEFDDAASLGRAFPSIEAVPDETLLDARTNGSLL